MTNLKRIRKEKGFTQSRLAQQLGVDQTTLSRYESGVLDINKAEALVVYTMAQILECSVADILEGIGGKIKDE